MALVTIKSSAGGEFTVDKTDWENIYKPTGDYTLVQDEEEDTTQDQEEEDTTQDQEEEEDTSERVTLYRTQGTEFHSRRVPDFDVSYYQDQGYTTDIKEAKRDYIRNLWKEHSVGREPTENELQAWANEKWWDIKNTVDKKVHQGRRTDAELLPDKGWTGETSPTYVVGEGWVGKDSQSYWAPKRSQYNIPDNVSLPGKDEVNTNLGDVYNTFVRIMGRKPGEGDANAQTDWENIAELVKKSPQEVESSLQQSAPEQTGDTTTGEDTTTEGGDTTTGEGDTTTEDPYAASDKQIYQDPDSDDLYYKVGDKFYKIRDQEQLEKLVIEHGFQDTTRPELPEGWESGAIESDEEYNKRIEKALGTTKEAVQEGKITQNQKRLIDTLVKAYPKGVEVDPQEILDTFKQVEEETIDPYFKELTRTAAEDFKDTYERQQEMRELAKEEEEMQAQQDVREMKRQLEKQGLTFSGEAVRQLGQKSAYPQEGAGGVPEQTKDLEGRVPALNRLRASSSEARYEQQTQELGRKAEDYMGTERMKEEGIFETIPFESAGVDRTAQVEQKRQQIEASTLQNVINNYAQKQEGMQDKEFDFGSWES